MYPILDEVLWRCVAPALSSARFVKFWSVRAWVPVCLVSFLWELSKIVLQWGLRGGLRSQSRSQLQILGPAPGQSHQPESTFHAESLSWKHGLRLWEKFWYRALDAWLLGWRRAPKFAIH